MTPPLSPPLAIPTPTDADTVSLVMAGIALLIAVIALAHTHIAGSEQSAETTAVADEPPSVATRSMRSAPEPELIYHIGDRVTLTTFDHYLALYHNARPGTIGTITGLSKLGPDDRGVLVDWGDAEDVLCERDEITIADRGSMPVSSSPVMQPKPDPQKDESDTHGQSHFL